ncbi:hypothetical protein F5B19DRAFT_242483 [Rostrohypoxylon terebratum]|nr:hypothetical protein F5B19DRAFT_242483 [Rostrohypoxylon terebratum]
MMYHKLILALAGFFTLAISSRDHRRSEVDIEPWQVTRLTTFSPSGRPGNDNTAYLYANITNPNSIPAGPGVEFDASSANCTADWTYIEEEPYNITYTCDTTETQPSSSSSSISTWTIEVLEADNIAPSPTTNFDVKFTLTTKLTVDGEEYSKTMTGRQHFQVGDNLSGACGASGVCSWSLKGEVLIQPTIVACQGTC